MIENRVYEESRLARLFRSYLKLNSGAGGGGAALGCAGRQRRGPGGRHPRTHVPRPPPPLQAGEAFYPVLCRVVAELKAELGVGA